MKRVPEVSLFSELLVLHFEHHHLRLSPHNYRSVVWSMSNKSMNTNAMLKTTEGMMMKILRPEAMSNIGQSN